MTLGETLGIGLGFLAIVAPDFWPKMPRVFSYALAAIGLAWLAYSGVLGLEEATEMKLRHGPLALFIIGAVIIGCSIFWHISRLGHIEHSTPKESPQELKVHETLFNAQLQEVINLQSFIGGKDEMALREMFDLHNILDLNLMLNKLRLSGSPQAELKRIEQYFIGGEDAMFPEAFVVIQDPTTLQTKMAPRPGYIGLIKQSGKYKQNVSEIRKYADSVHMPLPILVQLKAFHFDVLASMRVMFNVINEFYSKDSNYILMYNAPESRYWRAIQNNVWLRVQLKPKYDGVIVETRKYLNVN